MTRVFHDRSVKTCQLHWQMSQNVVRPETGDEAWTTQLGIVLDIRSVQYWHGYQVVAELELGVADTGTYPCVSS